MNNVPIVTLFNTHGNLSYPLFDIFFGDASYLSEVLFDLTTLAVFHGEHHLVVNNEMVVNVDNVFTLNPLECLCFLAYLKGIARLRQKL